MEWFTNCTTVNEVRVEYRRLAFAHHPDKGGDTRTMQDINAAYLVYLSRMDRQTSKGRDGRTHTYYYNEHVERASMDVIDRLIVAGFSGEVTIELLGTWVWVDGIGRGSDDDTIRKTLTHPTKTKRDGSKALLLRWHSKRELYYWAPDNSRSSFNPKASMNDLRYTYGSRTFTPEEKERKSGKAQPVMAFGN